MTGIRGNGRYPKFFDCLNLLTDKLERKTKEISLSLFMRNKVTNFHKIKICKWLATKGSEPSDDRNRQNQTQVGVCCLIPRASISN